MKLVNYSGFCHDCKHFGLEYAARHSRALELEAVEFLNFVLMDEFSPSEKYSVGETKKILDAYGLEVSCYSVCVDLLSDNAKTIDLMRRQVEFAAGLSSPRVHHTLIPGLDVDSMTATYDEALERVYPRAVAIANACREYGIECLYEPQGLYFNGVRGLGQFYERIKSDCPNVGICGDVGNGLFVDHSATEIYSAFANEIRHVHLKDYRVEKEPIEGARGYVSKGGSYLYDCRLGEGVTDFDFCFEGLKRVNYAGDLSFEIKGDDQTVKQAIEFVRRLEKEKL